MKDLYNNIILLKNIDPIVGGDSSVPSAVEIDLGAPGCGSAVIGIYVGLEGSTLSGSNYWKWAMTHADDDGTGSADSYSNVAAADVQGVTPSSGVILTVDDPSEDNVIHKFGYIGGKRFLKITPTETGTAPDLPFCVFVIKGNLLDAPPI